MLPQKIHDKVMSLGYQDAVTEIYSVDSQYSLNDGVIVQVTGSLRCTVSLEGSLMSPKYHSDAGLVVGCVISLE